MKTEAELNEAYAQLCLQMGDCTIKMVGLTKRHDRLIDQFNALAAEIDEHEEIKRKNAVASEAEKPAESAPSVQLAPPAVSATPEAPCTQ